MNIGKKFLAWLSKVRLYKGGIILFGDSHYEIKGHDSREIMELIQPGDIILKKYKHYLGNIIISLFSGTYWPHIAVYVGDHDGLPGRVIHMVGEGIANDDLLTFLRADNIKVMRCKKSSYVDSAVIEAKYYFKEKPKYDIEFSFTNNTLYCSELILLCYPEATFSERIKESIIYPDDFLKSIFDVVWEKK